jgi:hypothetical protein
LTIDNEQLTIEEKRIEQHFCHWLLLPSIGGVREGWEGGSITGVSQKTCHAF